MPTALQSEPQTNSMNLNTVHITTLSAGEIAYISIYNSPKSRLPEKVILTIFIYNSSILGSPSKVILKLFNYKFTKLGLLAKVILTSNEHSREAKRSTKLRIWNSFHILTDLPVVNFILIPIGFRQIQTILSELQLVRLAIVIGDYQRLDTDPSTLQVVFVKKNPSLSIILVFPSHSALALSDCILASGQLMPYIWVF